VGARAVPERLLTAALVLAAACDLLPRAGDTRGEQRAGRWEQRGRLIVETDPRYTLVRLNVDTAGVTARHDVILARFEFGDSYALTIGLELGDATALERDRLYRLGMEMPATGTVTCLCRPLRPDSVRGTYAMSTRGLRQIVGRIDATLYFTAWDDSTVHTTYALRQRIHGVRP
jgi:hypothetical protein